MDPQLLQRLADALAKTRRGEDAREELLDAGKNLGPLVKDFRQLAAQAVLKVYPDGAMHATYAPHRKDGVSPDELPARIRTALDSLARKENTLPPKESFDFLLEVQARLDPTAPKPLRKRGDLPLGVLAPHYAAAKIDGAAKAALARELYQRNGAPTEAAAALFTACPWLRERIEELLGDALPRPQAGGFRATLARVGRDVLAAVMELQPAFVLAAGAVLLSAILLVVVAVAARPSSAAAAPAPTPPPAAPPSPAPEPTAFERFAKAVAAQGDKLKDAVIVVLPRGRDDMDKALGEILAAEVKEAYVLPWAYVRRVLGDDAPEFGDWLTTDDLNELQAAPDEKPAAGGTRAFSARTGFLAEIEARPDWQARITLYGLSPARVVCSVTGKAPGVAEPRNSAWHLDRANAEFRADFKGRKVALLARQARAAAKTDGERGAAYLFEGQLMLCRDKRAEARQAFTKAVIFLGDQARAGIPDPEWDAIAKEALSAKARVATLVELRPTIKTTEAANGGAH